jgi:hypothetical protein
MTTIDNGVPIGLLSEQGEALCWTKCLWNCGCQCSNGNEVH